VRSAALVEALSAVHHAARLAKRPEEADRYGRALAYGARYLIQLQVRREDTWAVRRPAAVLGGFRTSLVDHGLKSAETGRSILALADVLRTLSPEEIDRFADPTAVPPVPAPPKPILKEE